MMKKLTKAALLAAATAFMLAGFPACEHDDNNKTEQSGGGSGEQSGGGSGEQGSGEQGGDDDEPVTVNAGWTFTADSANSAAWILELGANSNWKWDSNSDVKGKVQTEDGIAITPTTGAGATFTFLKTSKSIESGGSSGWKTGTSTKNGTKDNFTNFAEITVTGACTVTITGKGGGKSEDAEKGVRGFSIKDGDSEIISWVQNNTTSSENFPDTDNSFSAVAGKTYKLYAAGVNFYSITCSTEE